MNKDAIVSLVKEMFGTPEAAWVSGVRFTPDMLQKVVDHAARVERKACVSVCREHAFMATSRDGAEWALSCAHAIAARGDA